MSCTRGVLGRLVELQAQESDTSRTELGCGVPQAQRVRNLQQPGGYVLAELGVAQHALRAIPSKPAKQQPLDADARVEHALGLEKM